MDNCFSDYSRSVQVLMRVDADIEESLIEVDGKPVNGIVVTCERCGHDVQVAGQDSPATRQKALDLLRETCPEKEGNYYRIPKSLDDDQGEMHMENDYDA